MNINTNDMIWWPRGRKKGKREELWRINQSININNEIKLDWIYIILSLFTLLSSHITNKEIKVVRRRREEQVKEWQEREEGKKQVVCIALLVYL